VADDNLFTTWGEQRTREIQDVWLDADSATGGVGFADGCVALLSGDSAAKCVWRIVIARDDNKLAEVGMWSAENH
jgi:hypothetical protein